MTDDVKDDPLELLRCSQINFDNLIASFPVIKDHPFYKIARLQLDLGVEGLETK